ncbi:TetR/AcrR family transcriptional regulator [Arthrobacter sp. GCM10027362]|uniref:TetR/AcrR family transcriptional regulator n=1 Tax=Arthrobacter sp. GCM10027362 TaxID=3273379 RepID=UPI003644D621
MPRISAPTVAEHRATQQRALLAAARALLAADPEHVPSLADIARQAGLARPSVYQYYRSREDLFAALVADTFPRWSRRITGAMGAEPDPGRKVMAYVMANLDLIQEGEHAVGRALAAAAPGTAVHEHRARLHAQLLEPVIVALGELGAPDPAMTAEMINAVVFTASRLLESGSAEAGVRARVAELLGPYLIR